MKKSFTLIEVVVTTSIIVILLTTAIPIYDKYILKAHFEEAKVNIYKISLANERYKLENAKYYNPNNNLNIINENQISEDLDIDLSVSNNFIYKIKLDTDKLNYFIFAYLRFTKNTTCDDDALNCKQLETNIRDDWVDIYETKIDNHYMVFQYPNTYSNNSHFNYEHIYDGD